MGTRKQTRASVQRRKMGRPAGPPENVRRNFVRAMVTDAELAKLKRMADEHDKPLSTTVYEILARALKRRK